MIYRKLSKLRVNGMIWNNKRGDDDCSIFISITCTIPLLIDNH